jgi:hypothetical protein
MSGRKISLMTEDIKIFDNFLEKNIFLELKNILFSDHFPWYYNDYKSAPFIEEDKHFQLIHNFYLNESGGLVSSNFFNSIFPIIEKINLTSLVRVKANLTTKTSENYTYGFHTDVTQQDFVKTGIFYLNSSNGGTIFKDGTIVECIENRFIYFPSKLVHSGISATDVKSRIVINFNYV